jgi:hypothetical protein
MVRSTRQGLPHRPQTTVEVGMLIVGQLREMNGHLRAFTDIMRAGVGLLFRWLVACCVPANRLLLGWFGSSGRCGGAGVPYYLPCWWWYC